MVHGASLPNVQAAAAKKVEAAKLRLIEDADLAVDTLFELLKPGTADNVKLGAAKEILDRSGIKGTLDVNIEVSHANPSEDILKKLAIMRDRAEAAKAEEAEIVDAEELTDEGEKQAEAPLHVNSVT
jgi:hypothetical protein